jgi:Zn-finger nucleic acid-binding protein
MEKAAIGDGTARLTLDCCPRCGGLWFDRGEVGRLAQRKPTVIAEIAPRKLDRIRPPCAGCHTPLDRDAAKCAVCGRPNVLDCPVCDQAMERREHAGLVLDLCRRCHGVWFDNAELSAIWRMNLAAATARRGRGSKALAAGGDVLLEAMFWSPDLVLYGGMAAAEAVSHLAGPAAEVAGDAAEGVFSFIMEIISGLFDGF